MRADLPGRPIRSADGACPVSRDPVNCRVRSEAPDHCDTLGDVTARLPVLEAIDDIRRALRDDGACVLIAPPGTGKTTAVPPLLLEEPWVGGGRIMMLEPRRLAARASAARMAHNHGERVGRTFGYSVRGDTRTSASTSVEVVTEGLFLRRLQNDPELSGVSAVILDEFHERSVDADLALALIRDVRSSLRPDLRVVVMSATMDPEPVAALLTAPVVRVSAPIHPVETFYRPGSVHEQLERRVADVVLEATQTHPGDVLVFLPGRPEIHRTHRILEERLDAHRTGRDPSPGGIRVVDLHGSLTPDQQQSVLEPDPDGRRRIVLATSIAETSLTIPGVRIVVDSGRRRTNRVDPNSGLPALVTVPVSRAGADQRSGRAGRTSPGVSYRLWSSEDERHRPDFDQPEIFAADLSPLLLQLRAWGVDEPSELDWLDDPPAEGVENAASLLELLGAVDETGRLTPRGREFADIGFHPRLAAMAVMGIELGQHDLAARICALVETSRTGAVDLLERLEAIGGPGSRPTGSRPTGPRSSNSRRRGPGTTATRSKGFVDGDLGRSIAQWSDAIRTRTERGTLGPAQHSGSMDDQTGRSGRADDPAEATARILLAGYPDRVARRRDAHRDAGTRDERVVFQLRSGGEVTVAPDHQFRSADWIIVADLDRAKQRLHLGVPVSADTVMELLGSEIRTESVVTWNDRDSVIEAKELTRLGSITISEKRISDPPAEAVRDALHEAYRRRGPSLFPRLVETEEFRARVSLVGLHHDEVDWPDLSDETLEQELIGWMGPRLDRVKNSGHLDRIDIGAVLRERFRWDQIQRLEELTPTTWKLASGRTVRLRYGRVDGDAGSVVARVRLGDAIGTDVHPMVLGGRLPVTVELLSPAGRPVQRTTDLPGFWRGSYAAVRSDLRGRYPKHPWPVDPWNVPPRRHG